MMLMYNAFPSLVRLIFKVADVHIECRQYREELHEYFPLTVEMWKEWLSDEKNVLVSDSEKYQLLALYRRSFQDFQCI
jgi:hypothetical protein